MNLLTLLRCQFQIVENFVHQQLSFAIRVTCMNHFVSLDEEFFDGVKLFSHRRARLQLPFFRHNRQIGKVPTRETRIVSIRLGLFEQVADTPGNDLPITTLNEPIATAMGLG
ncbi:hypothetical protein D3C75_597630 [compost metagenome]